MFSRQLRACCNFLFKYCEFIFFYKQAKETVVEKPEKSPKKAEKVVAEPAKEENGAKKGRGRPPKAAVAAKPAKKAAPPKRAAPAGSGKGKFAA